MKEEFNSQIYKRSRNAYMAQCTFEYFVTIMMADVYLSSLLTNLGISDGAIGVISSFISLAFLFQLASIFVVQRIENTKRFVITFSTISQLVFMGVYLIPFMPISQKLNLTVVTVFILVGYFANYICATILFKWANSYVDPNKRGTYSAVKEIISLLSGMGFTIFVGFQVDKFKSSGNIEGGFAFIAITIFILAILNFICLMFIKNRKNETCKENKIPIKEVLKNTVGNKSFFNVIILTSLLQIARYTTVGFLGTFKTKELFLTIGTVQIINTVANIFRMIISKPFGRYSDKHSYAKGMKLGIAMEALSFLCCVFTTKNTWWLIILYTLLNYGSAAGTNQNSFNITYSYVDEKYFVQAMAIKNSIGGVLGFTASIVAGKFLHFVQQNGNMLFGIHIYGQQFLGLISFIIMIILILFINNVIEKQKVVKR